MEAAGCDIACFVDCFDYDQVPVWIEIPNVERMQNESFWWPGNRTLYQLQDYNIQIAQKRKYKDQVGQGAGNI